MTHPRETEKLRLALRRMDREALLLVAERAIDLVPKGKLGALAGDLVGLEEPSLAKSGDSALLAEVRKFHEESLRGEYYEDFPVNSRNFTETSEGTEAFIAEFNRLLEKCTRAAEKGPRARVREAFELLFELLRRMDDRPDDIVFFADEAGSWQVGVDWRATLPAYFRCLAECASPGDYAREVDRTISDFADYERPQLMAAARRVASKDQEAALGRLAKPTRR